MCLKGRKLLATPYQIVELLYFVVVCRARRAAKEAKEAPSQPAPERARIDIKKFVKIGRPGYKGR